MPRPPFTFCTLSIVVLFQGCSLSSTQQSQQVQVVGDGMYSIGVSRTSSLLDSSASHKGLDAAIGKAGDYCHAKGQKLADSRSVGNTIVFKCVSGQTPR